MKVKEIVKKWRKRQKKSRQRFYLLREWSETEKNYIKDLKKMKNEI
jgi:hypothetical protein